MVLAALFHKLDQEEEEKAVDSGSDARILESLIMPAPEKYKHTKPVDGGDEPGVERIYISPPARIWPLLRMKPSSGRELTSECDVQYLEEENPTPMQIESTRCANQM